MASVNYGVDRISFFLPKHIFFQAVVQRAAEFSACTGVQIDFPDKDNLMVGWGTINARVNDDLGTENCALDASGGVSCTVTPGIGLYDAYLIKTGWVEGYAHAKLLEPFNSYIDDNVGALNWFDMFPVIRKNLAAYDGEVVVMPVDADFSTLVVREDTLETYKAETNIDVLANQGFGSWSDLVAFIQHMDHRDFDGDGEVDSASCLPRCGGFYMELGGPFYMMYAGLIQTLGPEQGIHFDPETMEPLFNNDGFLEAVELYRNLSYECPMSDLNSNVCSKPPESVTDKFTSGKCVVMMNHPGPTNSAIVNDPIARKDGNGNVLWQPKMADGTTFAGGRRLRMPGWKHVVDRSSGKTVACDDMTCPLQDPAGSGINRSPVINGGNTLAIRASASNQTKAVLKDFFAYLNLPSQSLPDTATPGTWNNHWRASHVEATAWATHQSKGWTRQQFDDLAYVTEDLNSENPSLELRLRGYTQYIYDIGEPTLRHHFGYASDADGCLHPSGGQLADGKDLASNLTARWNEVTESYGRLSQIMRYRQSLGLAPLSSQTLCDNWLTEMARAGLDPRQCVLSCGTGSFYNLAAGGCQECPVGTYSNSAGAVTECQACPAGYFCGQGTSFPSPCAVATFSNESSASCSECPSGRAAATTAQSECAICQTGRFAAAGSSNCEACNAGEYQHETGAEGCLSCQLVIKSSTTVVKAATSAADCECPAGSYLLQEGSQKVCAACEEGDGLFCPGGLGPPQQAAGFFAREQVNGLLVARPQMVNCASSAKCPKGLALGHCGPHQELLACDSCETGWHWDGTSCRECSASDILPSVLLFLLGLTLAGALCFALTRPRAVFSSRMATILVTFGVTANVIQSLGAFSDLSIEWIEPMASLRTVLQFVTFDVQLLSPGCFFNTNSAVLQYLASVLLFPVFATVLLLCFGIRRLAGFEVTEAQVINGLGSCAMLIYLALAITAVMPWQCSSNPDGSSSIRMVRSVHCWESGNHNAMVGLSILAILLYICAPVAIVTWATLVLPQRLYQSGGIEFVNRFRFLFDRVTADKYYFVLVYLIRNLFIAFIPVVFVNYPELQLTFMAYVIVASALAQSWLTPWRTTAANLMDATFSLLLSLLLFAGALLVTVRKGSGESQLQGFMIFILVMLVFVFLTFFGKALAGVVLRSRPYSVFLSHHKGGAAVLARWFKLLMADNCSGDVFLDTDNLDSLDVLFDVVANQSQVLVLLLSSEVLSRVWCAGEIVSALRNNVPIVLVALDDYIPFSDDFLSQIDDMWSDAQKASIMRLGITIDQVRESYKSLRQMEAVKLDRRLPEHLQMKVVERVMEQCPKGTFTTSLLQARRSFSKTRSSAVQTSQSVNSEDFVIIGSSEPEPRTTQYVLRHLLQARMQISFRVEHVVKEIDFGSKMKGVVLVLSKGDLLDPDVANAAVTALDRGINVVPMVIDISFAFPDEVFWAELSTGKLIPQGALEAPLTSVIEAYKHIFGTIALRFTPHGSSRLHETEISECTRKLDVVFRSRQAADLSLALV